MENRKVSMKKILVGLLTVASLATAPAKAHGQHWVGPALIGGIVGYSLAQPRYYYGPYGYTTPPPVIIQQAPVVVQQQPPVYVQPQGQQVCEEKAFQDNQGQWRNGTFCYIR
jgi:hypothetical protein